MTEVKDKTKDPVCGMELSKTETEYTSDFKGTVFYFCSAECKTKFDSAPSNYEGSKAA